MKDVFIVPDGVDLPPMKSGGAGPQFHYIDVQENNAGGYSLIGSAPDGSGDMYVFDASPENIAAWKAGGVFQWGKDVLKVS